MIERFTALIICTLFFLIITPHMAMSDPMLEFVGAPTTVDVNETFSLDVVLSGMADSDSLSTFDFNINFDPIILVISGHTFSDGLSDPLAWYPNDQYADGLDTGAANFSDTSWSMNDSFFADQFDGTNSLTLLTLDFTALSVGQSVLEISGPGYSFGAILGDQDGNSFPFTIGNSSVTVAPVPEPSSLLLIGTGLVGLAAIRRRASPPKKNSD